MTLGQLPLHFFIGSTEVKIGQVVEVTLDNERVLVEIFQYETDGIYLKTVTAKRVEIRPDGRVASIHPHDAYRYPVGRIGDAKVVLAAPCHAIWEPGDPFDYHDQPTFSCELREDHTERNEPHQDIERNMDGEITRALLWR